MFRGAQCFRRQKKKTRILASFRKYCWEFIDSEARKLDQVASAAPVRRRLSCAMDGHGYSGEDDNKNEPSACFEGSVVNEEGTTPRVRIGVKFKPPFVIYRKYCWEFIDSEAQSIVGLIQPFLEIPATNTVTAPPPQETPTKSIRRQLSGLPLCLVAQDILPLGKANCDTGLLGFFFCLTSRMSISALYSSHWIS
jgi:hypothetical protein